MINQFTVICLGLGWIGLTVLASPAQEVAEDPIPIDITADALEYLADQTTLVGAGNVVVQDGDTQLRADYMTVNTESYDVYARGNVVYEREGRFWRGEEFAYNLKTRTGDFGTFDAYMEPFYISAGESKRISTNLMILSDVMISTCEGERPPIYIRAREGRMEGRRVYTKGATFYAGYIPFMYLPSYSRSLDPHARYFEILPGYSSRLGAFLLTGYHYKMTDSLKGVTHADYRSRRGFGFGQDFIWQDKVDQTWNGQIRGYYTSDDDPLRSGRSEERNEDLVDEERYRIRLSHFHKLSPRDFLIAEVNYLSDPYILEDFFNQEFRNNVQPENRVTLTHRGDLYTAALQLNKRLNDFYENVDRLPELSLDYNRQPLFDSDFFYESRSTASFLERVFMEDSEEEDYDSFRFDSGHTVFYPTRHFGFLNIIPRAGYRGTYYTETFQTQVTTNQVIETDEEGVSIVRDDVQTRILDTGADLRNVFQLGWEGSFKAFRTWDEYMILDGDGVRHVAEPYLNHTYIPEPNLVPGDLPQFDAVDTIDKRHDIQLGMRNKLQTRRNGTPVDLIYLNVFSFYRLDPNDDQEDFSDVFFDSELKLVPNFSILLDGAYDTYESQFNQFSGRANYIMNDESTLGLEYFYRLDASSLVSASIELFPQNRWSFDAMVRYDVDESELEEHSYFVKRTGACTGWGLGYRNVDEDHQVWLQFWLTAFPETSLELGN